MDTVESVTEAIQVTNGIIRELTDENKELAERMATNKEVIARLRPGLTSLGNYRDRLRDDIATGRRS